MLSASAEASRTSIERVTLQTFFKEKKHQKLLVVHSQVSVPVSRAALHQDKLEEAFKAVQEEESQAFSIVETPEVQGAITSWMSCIGFHIHLNGLSKESVHTAVSESS